MVWTSYQAARDVEASQDALAELFERIESFFGRLEIYTEVSPTHQMIDLIVKIMVEVLGILAIATKEIKQRLASALIPCGIYFGLHPDSLLAERYLNKLLGKTDIEDSLKRLDKLTQEEALMAYAEVLKVAHRIDDKVASVNENVKVVIAGREKLIQLGVEAILNTYMSRWKGSKGGSKGGKRHNTTHGRWSHSNQGFVSSFSISTLWSYNRSLRESNSTGPSRMAPPTGSGYEPQRRVWCSP